MDPTNNRRLKLTILGGELDSMLAKFASGTVGLRCNRAFVLTAKLLYFRNFEPTCLDAIQQSAIDILDAIDGIPIADTPLYPLFHAGAVIKSHILRKYILNRLSGMGTQRTATEVHDVLRKFYCAAIPEAVGKGMDHTLILG